MARIDYGQAPQAYPDLKNCRVFRRYKDKNNYTNVKIISNSYLNSSKLKRISGFSMVGKHRETGRWGIIRVWWV